MPSGTLAQLIVYGPEVAVPSRFVPWKNSTSTIGLGPVTVVAIGMVALTGKGWVLVGEFMVMVGAAGGWTMNSQVSASPRLPLAVAGAGAAVFPAARLPASITTLSMSVPSSRCQMMKRCNPMVVLVNVSGSVPAERSLRHDQPAAPQLVSCDWLTSVDMPTIKSMDGSPTPTVS